MGFFEQEEKKLIFRENGETVWVEAWGRDSLRVRSAMLGDMEKGSVALLAAALFWNLRFLIITFYLNVCGRPSS